MRIVMLGDSFTEAGRLPLVRTPARRTEALLNDHGCACRFEVVNAGTSGYSPILEYLLLKRIAPRLSPDLVVLNFDMTDVHDDFVRSHLATFDSNGLPIAVNPDRRLEASLLMPPLPKPAALRFVAPAERAVNRLSIYQDFRKSTLGRRMFGPLNLGPEDLEARGLVGNLWYDRLAPTRNLDSAEIQAAWAVTSRYIVGIRDLARQHDSGFALVTYPHAHQVSATESPIGRRDLGIGDGFFSSERPFQTLEAIGRREDFTVINLLRLFRARAATGVQLFRVDDFHHTAEGASLLGEGVARGLLEKGVVTCRPACSITGVRLRR